MGKLTINLQNKIVEMRAQGLSQRQVAEALHISRNTLRKWEDNTTMPTEILRRQNQLKNDILEEARVTNAARLEVIKGLSNKLLERLASADFSQLPPDKAIKLLMMLQEKGSQIAFNMTGSEDYYNAHRGDKSPSLADLLGL